MNTLSWAFPDPAMLVKLNKNCPQMGWDINIFFACAWKLKIIGV